jgi:hypothetical protein
MLGATLEPFYQVLEFVNRFNFRSCNPRIPAPLATPAMVGARLAPAIPAPLSGPSAPSSLMRNGMLFSTIDPLIATGVVLATAATDAVYVMFTSAVVARHRVSAASWSSIWYLLSSFAVIHYTENWLYVAFAAAGSWIGAFASLSFLHRPARPLQ